ncbi:transcription factor IIIC subunit delta N-term-domain-containing protein [Amylocystis lapponica]|nr:transcription factor IIIC subunit delta N-term-domain-containing protein [Amylocystis lapponica]
MDQLMIYTALSLPAVSASPSANCLRWTGDGQLVMLTKSAVYILVLHFRLLFSSSDFNRSPIDTENLHNGVPPIGWLRTMIEFDKTLAHQWPADCQDWGAVSLGSLDPVLRAVAASPSNISADGGCVVAVLNSNMELAIWAPVKNHLRGQWLKLRDVSPDLFSALPIEETLAIRSAGIEWSSQADFALTPSPAIDGSLLAIGNRAGSITFLRYFGKPEANPDIRSVASLSVGDRWIVHLAWSPWRVSERGICEGFLACGSSDGSISVVRVVQTLLPATSLFIPDYEVKRSYEPILVHSKPGVLHFWSSPSPATGWSGSRAIPIHAQKLSVGSSALCSVTGAEYIRTKDVLVVSLSDGSFHVVHTVSTEPSLAPLGSPPPAHVPTSEAVSAVGRSVFLKVESEDLQFKDVNHINGMASYDDHAAFVWIHEASRPTDFSYKHDAKHVSMFVVAQLWSEDDDERILRDLKERITGAKACSGQSPISVLRPVFLHLRDPPKLLRLDGDLAQILQPTSLEDFIQVIVPPYTGQLTSELRKQFGRSFSTHIYGWDALMSERMKFVVSEFCRPLLSVVWHHVLRTTIRHVGAVITALSSSDVPFVRRVIAQASLPGIPADLMREAEYLAVLMDSVDGTSGIGGIDELCPACHAPVPLEDIATAECPNGHVWGGWNCKKFTRGIMSSSPAARCSVTSFILTTPMTQNIPPPSQASAPQNWLPQAVRHSWLVQDLLDAARRCFLCGNSFVAIL